MQPVSPSHSQVAEHSLDLFLILQRIVLLILDDPIVINRLILTILAQATTFTILVVVLHHFFEIFPCFHYQTVLITDEKVIQYIGTAIRTSGDLPSKKLLSKFILLIALIKFIITNYHFLDLILCIALSFPATNQEGYNS